MPTKCPQCGRENAIVNECRCDPNNLPTTVPPLEQAKWEARERGFQNGVPAFVYRQRDGSYNFRFVEPNPECGELAAQFDADGTEVKVAHPVGSTAAGIESLQFMPDDLPPGFVDNDHDGHG
jgi:hypothetical protein